MIEHQSSPTVEPALPSLRNPSGALLFTVVFEALANAIGHAFPERRSGDIRITYCRESDGNLVLDIIDDGVGLPRSLDPTTGGGLGFRLMKSVADQLEAGLSVITADEVTPWNFARSLLNARRRDADGQGCGAPIAFGDGERLEYTVIGAAVNLAAKLETFNKTLATRGLATREA